MTPESMIVRVLNWSGLDLEAKRTQLAAHAEETSAKSLALTLAALAVLSAIMWTDLPHGELSLWLATIALAGGLHVAVAGKGNRRLSETGVIEQAQLLFLSTLLSSAAWGAGVVWLYEAASSLSRGIILFAIAVLFIGAPANALPGLKRLRLFLTGAILLGTFALLSEWLAFTAALVLICWLMVRLSDAQLDNGAPNQTNQDYHARLAEKDHELAEADTLRTQFMGMIGHEIRTPMYTILTMSDLLKKTELDSRQQKLVHSLGSASEYLSKLLNDILDFSRLSAGKEDVEHSVFDLPELIENAIEITRPDAETKGLTLTFEVPENFPQIWRGVPAALNQVTLNLATNAVKYTVDGSIKIILTHSGNMESAEVHLSIADTGQGIAEEELNNIFDPFMQATDRDGELRGGVGLGLAICKGLVESLGGTIKAQSTLGEGSIFTVTLPFSPTNDPITPVEKPFHFDVSKLPSARVLVVDDTDLSLEATVEYLNELPFIIDTARDGREGLQLYQSRNYDLVLSDLRMPGMDGLEMTRAIRELEQSDGRRKVPVIILSAAAETEVRDEVLAAGGSAYLVKPVRQAELWRAVASYVGVRSDGQPSAPSVEASSARQASLDSLLPRVSERLQADLEKMQGLVQESGYAECSELAHAAKGYCGIFGFTELAAEMEELRLACEDQDSTRSQQALHRIEDSLGRMDELEMVGKPDA